MSSPDSNDAVNGKIDMGTRKLKAAYVENATTIYAYLESDFHVLKEYMERISEVLSGGAIGLKLLVQSLINI